METSEHFQITLKPVVLELLESFEPVIDKWMFQKWPRALAICRFNCLSKTSAKDSLWLVTVWTAPTIMSVFIDFSILNMVGDYGHNNMQCYGVNLFQQS